MKILIVRDIRIKIKEIISQWYQILILNSKCIEVSSVRSSEVLVIILTWGMTGMIMDLTLLKMLLSVLMQHSLLDN